MVERTVDGAKEGAAILFALRVGKLLRHRVNLVVHPAVVASHHESVFGRHATRNVPPFTSDCRSSIARARCTSLRVIQLKVQLDNEQGYRCPRGARGGPATRRAREPR